MLCYVNFFALYHMSECMHPAPEGWNDSLMGEIIEITEKQWSEPEFFSTALSPWFNLESSTVHSVGQGQGIVETHFNSTDSFTSTCSPWGLVRLLKLPLIMHNMEKHIQHDFLFMAIISHSVVSSVAMYCTSLTVLPLYSRIPFYM